MGGAIRTRALAVISLSLVVIAGAAIYQLRGVIGHPAPVRNGPGQAPYAIGRVWDCPPGWPIKAYQPGSVYYPTYHPAAPAYDVRPERCFQSTAEANSAGFRLAPAPGGGVVVESVYLLPTGKRLHDECLGAAGLVRYAIPCPTVLPAPAGEDLCPATSCVSGSTFSMSIIYATGALPGGGRLAPASYVQFFLTASPSSSAVGEILASCDRTAATQSVLGHQAAWGACLRGGDLISSLGWMSADTEYELQTREQDPSARIVIEYFASRLVEVAAAGR